MDTGNKQLTAQIYMNTLALNYSMFNLVLLLVVSQAELVYVSLLYYRGRRWQCGSYGV